MWSCACVILYIVLSGIGSVCVCACVCVHVCLFCIFMTGYQDTSNAHEGGKVGRAARGGGRRVK